MNARVRDAMIPEPRTLEAGATAQEAGEHLVQPDVRAVFVCDDHRLVGVVTRKTLVREVVAAGRHPRETTLGEIAEEPLWTLDSELPLDEAFWLLEERDAERVPGLCRCGRPRRSLATPTREAVPALPVRPSKAVACDADQRGGAGFAGAAVLRFG